MRIGIIGSGNVGGALGRRWADAGNEVMYGSREPSSGKMTGLVKAAGPKARAGTAREAASFGEVIVLATPWSATEKTLRELGPLDGKILLDCTNPLKGDMSGLEQLPKGSAAQQIASWAPRAKVVKIFNSTGAANMANPGYADGSPAMLYCGDDAEAKRTAAQLASAIGFDPVDVGPLSRAALLEEQAMLWISLAYAAGFGPDIAFRLMRR